MALDRLTKVDGGGISTTSDYRVGIITASKFVGPFDGTGGNFSGIITATGANFSGNVTIGGTLTYEDVTNIDSVGIITARDGIHVGAGVSVVGVGTFGSLDIGGDIDVDGHTELDRLRVSGIATFNNGIDVNVGVSEFGNNVTFGTANGNQIVHQQAASRFAFGDNCAIVMGASSDLKLIHDGSNSYIEEQGTGSLFIKGGTLRIQADDTRLINAAGNSVIQVNGNSAELRFNGNRKLYTSNTGVIVNEDLDVDGHTNLDNVSIAGVTTAAGNIRIANNAPSLIFDDQNHSIDFTFTAEANQFKLTDSSNGDRVSFNSTGSVSFSGGVVVVPSLQCSTNVQAEGNVNIGDSIVHISDTDTKIRFPVADQISFETGGTNRLKIHTYASNNHVEIDSSTHLSLADNGSNGRFIYMGDADASSTGYMHLQPGAGSQGFGGGIRLYSHSNSTNAGGVYIGKSLNSSGAIIFGNGGMSPSSEYLRITSGGNVVIGSGAAASLLTLRSSGSTEITLVGGSSNDSGIYFNDGSNDGAVSYHHGSRELRFRSGGQNRLIIGTNGALLNTGSEATLNLTNSGSNATEQTATFYTSTTGKHNRVVIKTYTNGGGDPYIKFDAGGQDMVVGTRYAGTTNNLLVLGPGLDPENASSGIFVKGTGDVGIGIESPGVALDVSGAVQATAGYKTAGHPVVTYASFTSISGGSYATRLGSTGTSTLRHTQIYGGGSHIATFDGVNTRLGIGTDIPAQTLDVKGTVVQTKFAGSHSTGTIRKIFIYDTRMDSDGGAWRKSERIKTTSWYNETLGTSKRGTRAEFPVVAVLVLENYKLTIYDGDDPAMPMWMVFDRGPDNPSTNWWDGNNNNYGTDIHMLNGYMFMTTNAAGSYTANFISEEMRTYYSSTYSGARTGNTIADRNNQSFTVRLGQDNVGTQETGAYAQSVDMMVMDNSKVDPQTGLKQPHVLVGHSNDTGNHICVIGDDQLVLVRRTGSWQATGGCYEARFDHVHGGYWHSTGYHPETNASYPNHGGSIGYTDIITTSGGVPTMNVNTRSMYILGQGKGKDNTPPQLTGTYQHEGSKWTSAAVCNFWLPEPENANLGKANIARNGKYIGTQHGLLVMSHHLEEFGEQWNSSHTKAERTGNARKSLHAYIYKDSATGYLFGNDKGCYGHSTSTTSLQGWTSSSPNTNQLVTDPTFEDGANWTHIQPNAGVSHDTNANNVTCTSSGGSNIYSAREVTGLTSGQKYLFRLDYKRPSGTSNTGIILNSAVYNSGTSYAGSNSLPTKNNVYRTMSMEFEAPGSSIWLNVFAQGSIVIDNFFIMSTNGYERSLAYPARGAQVYGTVTRTPVASGAELTMLGNTDSSANYLLEKNIDIDFSQDWYLMCWCPKGTGKVSIEEFNTDGTYNNTVAMITMANGNESSVRYAGSPFTSHTTQYYKFHCVTHEGATNTTRYYVGPGHLLQEGTQANWSSSKEADLHIGRGSYNNTYSHTVGGSNTGVSLVRYGQGLPQKEHLEKIYYDELKLMQPNAKCTIYGSSNDVRAIAWDKSTDITHVGTSSGRSDFLGLERINNTTTAVGEGMDAKNGLIVEAT